MAWLKRAWAAVSDVIWPSRLQCLTCDEMTEGAYLCDACAAEMNNLRLQEESGPIRSAFPYRGLARNLVHALKFDPLADAAAVLAQAMAEEASRMELPPDTVVTSVAMPGRRNRQRGIDHGRVLAEMVAAQLKLPYRPVLIRAPGGHTQRGLNRQRRLENLQGRFTAVPLSGESVLLVDDVLTTGATAAVCTRVLLDAGAGAVRVIAATHVIKEEPSDV